MKTFQQFMEDQSKNPFIDQKTGKQNVGPYDYGHNPPIHGLKSGNKYRNNILDTPGDEQDQYLQEPEVMKFFRDNDNKIKSISTESISEEDQTSMKDINSKLKSLKINFKSD